MFRNKRTSLGLGTRFVIDVKTASKGKGSNCKSIGCVVRMVGVRMLSERVSLGAEGVIPGRYIVSLLRVFKQSTHTLPSR